MREQVLAANMDLLFIVSGLDRDYNPRRLERYLVLAHQSGARPVVLLNKADLRGDLADVVRLTERHAPGVPVFALSALEQWGLEAISRSVEPGQTAALIGSSGAGKSTIVNALLGESRQRTTDVRESDSKGRHTTTHRELIRMPGNWLLMDLPGLRELQLWADPERVDSTFADIVDLSRQCRFRDCSHNQEPGCAVREADTRSGAPAQLPQTPKGARFPRTPDRHPPRTRNQKEMECRRERHAAPSKAILITRAPPSGTPACRILQLVCKLGRRATQRNALYRLRNQRVGDE